MIVVGRLRGSIYITVLSLSTPESANINNAAQKVILRDCDTTILVGFRRIAVVDSDC